MQTLYTDDLAEIQAAYGASSIKYEKLADRQLQNSDTIIISGYGCSLRVKNDALVIFPGKTHKDQSQDTTLLYRGMHTIKRIVLLSDKGVVSLDAVKWASEQDIAIMMLDGRGNLISSLSSENESDANLRRAQYRAIDSGQTIIIARTILAKKVASQIEVVRKIG